ncbi:unnamed protein product [Pedinophyceae sp. YPF-701]|nr:unnamed protein product [Pedinophyceae sp. YPF-701]
MSRRGTRGSMTVSGTTSGLTSQFEEDELMQLRSVLADRETELAELREQHIALIRKLSEARRAWQDQAQLKDDAIRKLTDRANEAERSTMHALSVDLPAAEQAARREAADRARADAEALRKTKAQVGELRRRVHKLSDGAEEYRRRCREAEQRVVRAEERSRQEAAQINTLTWQLQSANQELARRETTAAPQYAPPPQPSYAPRSDPRLEAELSALRRELEGAREEVREVSRVNRTLRDEAASLQHTLRAAHDARTRAEEDAARAAARGEALADQLARLQASAEALRGEAKSAAAQASQASVEAAGSAQELTELRVAVQRERSARRAAESKLYAAQSTAVDRARAAGESAAAKDDLIARLKGALKHATEQLEKCHGHFDAELKQRGAQLRDAETRFAQLQAMFATMV